MTEKRFRTLCDAVRWRVLAKYLGVLGVALAALNAVPLFAAALLDGPRAAAPHALALVALLGPAAVMARIRAPEHLQLNEALVVVVLAFVAGSIAMSYPLGTASETWLDGWFEAVSGITTTGLSTAASVEDKPTSFLFARAWLQWYGGLGIVVLSLALFMHNGVASRRLIETEPTAETLVSTTRIYARRIALVYGVLTLGALLAVWLATGDGFVALVHSLSAVSTGGFSSFDDSLARLDAPAVAAIMAFAWLGAVSLSAYHGAATKGPAVLLRNHELHALFIATVILSMLLYLSLPADGKRGFDALMLALGAQSTTGYTTVAIAELDPAAKLSIVASMLIGGSVGSTAGGFKLLRLLLLLKLLQLALARAAAPRHAVLEIRLGGRRVDDDALARAMLTIALFAILVFVSWLVFVAHGYPALDALFEVASASGTVGLSTGITRPELEPLLKAILCLNMLAGRVEILAVLVLLHPHTWIGKRREAS